MRDRFLGWLVHMATERRLVVLVSTVLLTVLSMAAAETLTLDMRWSSLLPEELPIVKEFVKIDNNYYQPSNMVVAIDGPDPVMLEQITDEVTELLQRELVCEMDVPIEQCKKDERYAHYIYGKMPEEWMLEKGLSLTKPKDVKRMKDQLSDPRLLPFLTRMNDDFEAEYSDSENVKNQERQIVGSLEAVKGLVLALEDAAAGNLPKERVERVVRDLTTGKPYMMSLDNSVSLVMVAANVPSDDIETTPKIDMRIEALLKPLESKYPDYKIERTGMTAVGRDEMDSIGPQTTMITLVALLLIFILLIWNFKSAMTPLISIVPIIIGIIWTMGFIAVTVGSMNMITSMIMVVLLGLGIDFSIHIACRFREEVAAGKGVAEALRLSIAETGVGVMTGAVTTAVAFMALMQADTKGVFEFGFCAGFGVIFTLLAVLWVMPSLLAFQALRREKKNKPPSVDYSFALLGSIAQAMGRWRVWVAVLGLLLTAAGIYAGTQLAWEYNFMELEPEGLRSVELQDEIVDKFKLSTTIAMLTVDDIEKSRALRKKFKTKRIVGDVDDISLWVSRPDFEKSRKQIRKLRKNLKEKRAPLTYFAIGGEEQPKLDQAESGASDEFSSMTAKERRSRLAEEIDRLWANMVEIQALSFTGGQDRVVEKTTQLVARRVDRDAGLLKKLSATYQGGKLNWKTVEDFERNFSIVLGSRADKMAENDKATLASMIPDDILARYTSRTDKTYLMSIMPRKNLFMREEQEMFQEVVEAIDPAVTGMPQMMLKMSLETMDEGKMAVIAALLVILLVLLLDFRRPLVAALAFLPLVSGIAIMLGVMWLLDEKLNYINMIALPVIIGIGVDDGVHFFHRFLQEGRGGLKVAVTGVGRAMLMSSLTTMIGFGSLMLYMMRGMASMGLVLFVGVGGCLLATFTILPALARMFENRIIRDQKIGRKK